MRYLSLFNGCGGLPLALDRAGIEVSKRFVSEIDKYAMAVNDYHYPDTVNLGDITKVSGADLGPIDLIAGGSPCQGFSFAGKQLNFEDPRSKLFFDFVRLLNECRSINPDIHFLLENVNMKQEHQDVISSYMGVQPVKINSALVSAQNRVRLYWTNIPFVGMPSDKGIVLNDVIEGGWVDRAKSLALTARYAGGCDVKGYFTKSRRQLVFTDPTQEYNSAAIRGRRINENGVSADNNKDVPITQCLQVKHDNSKSGCLTTVQKENVITTLPPGRYVDAYNRALKLGNVNPSGRGQNGNVYSTFARAPTLTTNKGEGVKIGHQVGTADNISGHDSLKRVYAGTGKAPCLTTMQGGNQEPKMAVDALHYRKLSPLECERLQTMPDNYTLVPFGNRMMSNSQRYKMCGNGWTIDVIAHLLSGLYL